MTIKQFVEKAIQGGWRHHAVNQAFIMFDGYENIGVFVNGFGWTIFHRKGTEPQGGAFQEKADSVRMEEILLDPLAWQAVGKVEGWEENELFEIRVQERKLDSFDRLGYSERIFVSQSQHRMHRMIDALYDRKKLEEAVEIATA